MSSDRLRQIEALYHAARDATTVERAALLARADPELRHEVESLLSERGGAFLDRPAIQHASDLLEDSADVPLAAGTRLGPYCIESKLGEGGMGEVFRAVDPRLRRAVAIKITREQFGARFEREARAIAALNHPHICTVHDVGPNFLVMELVEGETLAARLKRGPLPTDSVVLYASQIAAALAEAHGKGIVHRDLKPGNIMIARSGIKVLDFGLAKSAQDQTDTVSRTLMGTPGYMAPEQQGGKPADARSDLYAFGCVLYEMLTAARVTLPRRRISSRQLEQIVSRCLEEDPGRRWQSAAELKQELASITPGRPRTRVAVAAAAVLALSAAAYLFLHPAPKLTDRDTIVLAEFTNTTGDPVFDDTLRQGLAVQLQQSPFLSLISDARIRKTMALMDQPPDARLTSDIAQTVCVRTASAVVLEGSIARLGGQYVVGLRAKNCTTGEILADEQTQAARKEDVLGALSRMASRFRTRVGESLATIEKHSTPLEEATTPSLEALKAYSAGWKAIMSAGWVRSHPLFQRAVAIDPNFALAHAQIGFGYSVMGESALARPSILKAYQLRDRASDAERFFIETLYDRDVTGNLEREQRTLETWAESYPRDARPHGLISGLALTSTGRYELSIAEAEKAIALDPDLTPAYVNKAINQLYLDRPDDALLTVRRATERNLESPEWFLLVPYFVAFLKGADDELRQMATAGREIPLLEDNISHLEALALARSGRLQEARRVSVVPVEIAQRSGRRERAGLFVAATAVWEAFYGNVAAARQRAAKALDLGRGRDVDYAAAFALALSDDLPQSRALADNLAREFPEDTFVQFMYLPTLRALFSLNAHDSAAAIQALQTASRYDLALGGVGFTGRFGGLYPIYVRGKAYLEAHQPAAAVAEFQRILDHRSIVLVDPMDAMARLQLARALVLSGDFAKAKHAYSDLFTLWKDADPKIPIVNEARAEYEKLR